jgi:hypothetical protein
MERKLLKISRRKLRKRNKINLEQKSNMFEGTRTLEWEYFGGETGMKG